MNDKREWSRVTSVSVNGAILEEGTDYIIDSGTNTLTLLNARSDHIVLTIESHNYKLKSLPPPKPEKHYLKLKNDYQKRRR